MKLWLITQTANTGYDTYDGAVVVAPNAEEARRIQIGTVRKPYATWTKPENVEAQCIGDADPDLEAGYVVLSSFNAG